MSNVGILGMGSYLPARVMTNDDWKQYVETSDEWITSRTGIKRRRIARDDESTVTMATAAALSALNHAGLHAGDLGEIIVATDTPEVYVPDTASFLQHELGADEVASYTLGASGCSGFLQALDIARCRVQDGTRPILVVGVELLSRIISWTDRNTSVLFGDGAGAVILGGGSALASVLKVVAGTEGGHSEALSIMYGGTRYPFSLEVAQKNLHQRVVMDGRELFKKAVYWMNVASRRALSACGIHPHEVALVIPHQANLRIIEALAKSLQIPLEKFFINIEEYGNTGSASIPVALLEAHNTGRISKGDIVLLTAFGAGFHWAASLLRF